MGNPVDANINVSLKVNQTGVADLGAPSFGFEINRNLTYTGGVATIDQADVLFSDKRTLAASATENLDLAGVLVDALGSTVACAEVVTIYVSAESSNTNNVLIGGATTNAFNGPLSATGTYSLEPGEFVVFNSRKGWPVTPATGDILKMANSGAGTAVSYSIVIIGRTVAA